MRFHFQDADVGYTVTDACRLCYSLPENESHTTKQLVAVSTGKHI